ncbi:hypothetical protein [Glaciimonas sp. PCH181]|uniref:hypothetical protein n=1 Tax=Glaciimonas sp. PCH181 TaxID=2133943 RepID=UPI000D39D644|nr:hypothetical protein [Glaciimonas sp. PCH181]PUA19571.1 hypothetical protein C7W93_06920 [Glaciimonas sp. PCH181]
MATGDQSDIFGRIKSVIPRWFGPSSPLLDALVQGLSNSSAFVFSLYLYAKLQTRIMTATDGWLDMIAADYFGAALQRATNQSDASFRARIIINMFRERGTRYAITKVLTDLTGRAPIIFEPQRPADTGAYRAPNSGYGLAGGYGSVLIPYQGFIQAFRPLSTGIPYVAGYGSSPAGYSTPSQGDYATMSQITGAVTDADIYAAISSVAPIATIAWTKISS